MPSRTIIVPPELTPDQRRRQVAAILAQGVIRHRHCVHQAESDNFSTSCDRGLEVVSETRLSVSVGFDVETPNPECEVTDGRNA